MDGLHATATAGVYDAGDLIAFTTSLLITVLLLVLTLRAVKLPGTPLVNIVFAACGLLWSAGGLLHAMLLAGGMPRGGRPVLAAQAIQFLGAGAFPIPVLATWRPFALQSWQKTGARFVYAAACLSAAVIAILPWLGAVPIAAVRNFTAYSDALLLALGAFTCLRPGSTPRAVYLPSLAIVFAICAASLAMMARNRALGDWFPFIFTHLILLVVLCAFFLFARFRYADLFIRYGVRILLAGTWAAVLAFFAQSAILFHIASRSPSPQAVHVFGVILLGNALLLSFTFVDDRLSVLVNRWLFRAPDYRAERRQIADQLGRLELESEIAAAVENAARRPLELSAARLIALDGQASPRLPAAILEGEMVELGFEVLIPIASAGRVTHLLRVFPGAARPGFVSRDLDYLRAVAALCGNRLDALRHEREAVERRSREALLLQQVTEAELRALRAQINPHFLFNSLNTIADQIVRDPARAETMTLRLASVFRHVLAHSSRPLTSIRDEVEFLRTYLYIEEARFGDRLQVAIDLAPAVAEEHIPSLILQPLVENALKHGLGPKPGPVHLWISARADGDRVSLSVEDDGMGIQQPDGQPATQGLGLANIAERLRTLYQDRAAVRLEPREGGGSRVTVLIPRGQSVHVP